MQHGDNSMDSKTWNLISAALLILGFAVQWGAFANRISTMESSSERMLKIIDKNASTNQDIKESLGEVKVLIKSHLSAHEGLRQ